MSPQEGEFPLVRVPFSKGNFAPTGTVSMPLYKYFNPMQRKGGSFPMRTKNVFEPWEKENSSQHWEVTGMDVQLQYIADRSLG